MISPVLKKLKFKEHKSIIVLNSPEEFRSILSEMETLAEVECQLNEIAVNTMFIAFVQKESEVAEFSNKLNELIKKDQLIWFAYPKKSSKKYKAEINRDFGWKSLGAIGLEGVSAIAIDEDWSALRFRHVDFIKQLTRSSKMMLSVEGLKKKKN